VNSVLLTLKQILAGPVSLNESRLPSVRIILHASFSLFFSLPNIRLLLRYHYDIDALAVTVTQVICFSLPRPGPKVKRFKSATIILT
jgi:hypothetical protein